MRLIGIEAIYQKSRTSDSHPGHKIYPYLLRDMAVTQANQVGCTDITLSRSAVVFYIWWRLWIFDKLRWHSRKVLSWRLSNTMDTAFCIEALEEALRLYGRPEIFNTDQGSQFSSFEFTNLLKENEIKISMDGKGHWIDHVFIERLWRSLKYECVYLNAFDSGLQARKEIKAWINHYKQTRPHSTFNGQTPNEVYNVSHIEGQAPQYEKQAA